MSQTRHIEPMEPLVFTRGQVKRLFQVSARTVDRLQERGALRPLFLPGSRLPRFSKEAVMGLLDEMEQAAGRINPGASPESAAA